MYQRSTPLNPWCCSGVFQLSGICKTASLPLLAVVVLFSLLFLDATAAHAQAKTAPVKLSKRIYTNAATGLSVDAEISVSPKPTGGMVKIKYVYNGSIPVQESHANWKMSFLNENDQLVVRQLSVPVGGSELRGNLGTKAEAAGSAIDAPFLCQQLVDPCYDIKVSSRPQTGETIAITAIAPDSIGGPTALQPGQSATLRVVGGSLPAGGSWVWYEGQCEGARVGSGRSFAITPRGSTTYFARAEPGTGPCLTTTVRVDNRSVAPLRVSGPTQLCQGESLQFQVVGGALGIDAEWVWYRGGCGTTRVGTGRSFTTTVPTTGVSSTSLSYFVRAEGKYNTTACVQQTVAVTGSSESPASISASGSMPYCEGSTTPLSLKVVGGKLAPGAHWAWYEGSGNAQSIGQGEVISVSPSISTAYSVRAEGACPPSASASLPIQVITKSVGALGIIGPGMVTRRAPFTLQVNGGRLGENAQWKWYAKDCKNGRLLGSGPSLSLKLRKPTTVFVKAVGPCSESDCTSTTVSTSSARSWEHAFEAQKFIHFGYGFGLDYQHASILTRRHNYRRPAGTMPDDSVRSEADGVGLLGEFTFHPIIKNGFSLGLQSSAALGTGIYSLLNSTSSESQKKFSYYEFRVGGEMAAGHRRLKLLLVQEHRLREYRFENQDNEWEINQRDKTYFTKLGVGTRIGSYQHVKTAANNLDLLVYLSHTSSALTARTLYADTPNWNVGAGINWWCHNKLGLRLEAILKDRQKSYSLLNTNFYGSQFNATITLKEDFFR